jgi:hypothetical protein
MGIWPRNVDIQQADAFAGPGQPRGEVGGNGALAHASLARKNGQLVADCGHAGFKLRLFGQPLRVVHDGQLLFRWLHFRGSCRGFDGVTL